MNAKRNPLIGLAGDNPDKLKALGQVGRAAKAGWDAAAFEIIRSPLGQEYKKLGIHEDRIPQFAEDMRKWVTGGSKAGAKPDIEKYKDPVVPDWQAALTPKAPSRD